MTGGWVQYLAVFLSSATFCLFLVPLAIRFSWRIGSLDHPGGHKRQSSPVPYLGGVAIVLAFSVATMVASLVRPPNAGHRELNVIMATALILAAVGLLDDLKNLSPWARILVEIGCGIVIWNLGVGVSLTGLNLVDYGLTILWVVGITNAFNLLDNMDGLAAGQASICSVAVFVIAATNGQFLVAGLAISLAGCAAGFLRHNFHPARIYMGDGGALFLGFLIAYLGIKLRFADSVSGAFLVPVVICILPITDTTLVTLSRLVAGRSPFQGGQDHVSHRMVQSGIPVPVSVGLTYFASIAAGLLAYVISRVDQASAWVLFGFVVTTAVAAALLLALIPVYPNSRLRHFVIEERTEAT